MKTFTAQDAIELMGGSEQDIVNDLEYINVIDIIIDFASKGWSYVWVYEPIKTPVRSKLESDGFKVESIQDRAGTLIKISWL